MEIPAKIVEMIMSGTAKSMTAALGGSGGYSIPCPANKYLIIWGFTFNHFIDQEIENPQITKLSNLTHSVYFQSKENHWQYNFRTLPGKFSFDAINYDIYPINGAENIPVFMICKDDVNITLTRLTTPADWDFVFNTISTNKGSIQKPLLGIGYQGQAGAMSIVQRIQPDSNPLWIVNPVGARNIPNDGANIQLNVPIKSTHAIYQPSDQGSDGGATTYPLINVYYVIVNEPEKSTMRG